MRYDAVPDCHPILRGHGLTLRELAEEDLPAWFARLSDASAAALAGDPVATSIQDAIDGLRYHQKAFQNKEGMRWAIPAFTAGGGWYGPGKGMTPCGSICLRWSAPPE